MQKKLVKSDFCLYSQLGKLWCLIIYDLFSLNIYQDSLLDIVTSLGADEEKIILAGTAKANRFNLLDVSRNTPGSASVGMASTITYQQVCSFFFGSDNISQNQYTFHILGAQKSKHKFLLTDRLYKNVIWKTSWVLTWTIIKHQTKRNDLDI